MKRLIPLSLFLCLLFPQFIRAQTTVTVGQGAGYDYGTIQAGIDAATTGDVVVVYPGVYYGNIRFRGNSIVLRSTDPTSGDVVAATIIDGRSTGTVVTFAGTETNQSSLAGFTIRNGNWGGVNGQAATPTIEYNIITTNHGRGLAACNGMIRMNRIVRNQNPGLVGGGLWQCHGLIEQNVIAENISVLGGGLGDCDGTIRNNIITENSVSSPWGIIVNPKEAAFLWTTACDDDSTRSLMQAHGGSHGGGLEGCDGIIEGNLIIGNRAGGWGGGLSACRGIIRNNIIAGNHADLYGGGGLNFCTGRITNNTVAGNFTRGRGAGLLQCNALISNCIIWGNSGGVQVIDSTTPTYSCIQDWAGGGEGNIASYPWFADDNYYLLPKSPCVDAGNPVAEYNDACRPPALGTIRNDMGAYGGPYNCLWPAPPPSARAPRWRLYR